MSNGIVLMVEDNPRILDLNRRILENEGLVVLTAKTIAEARERLKIAIPNAVVLDVMLPDGNGVDFLKELREVCDAPVLFLTAKADRSDIMAGLTAGGNDYITKPYNIDEFCMRVMGFMRLMSSLKTKQSVADESPAAAVLTEKELAIAVLAADGMCNKDIAERCILSESRVKTCLSGIYRKLKNTKMKNKRAVLAELLVAQNERLKW
jgi:DNA-binding response OmpR family regulator